MSINLGLFKNMFTKEVQAQKEVELPKQKNFRVLTDKASGVTKMEAEFLQPDKTYAMVRTETRILEDGTKEVKTKVYGGRTDGGYYFGSGDEGLRTSRTKLIKVEDGKSEFGGKKITVDKKYEETMAETAKDVHLEKHYDTDGTMQHMEGSKKYRYEEEPKTATIDKVYDEVSLPHSENELFEVNPREHAEYKHSTNRTNNYDQFADEGTNFTRAKQAKADAVKKAEEEKLAQELAEKNATEKLKASRPRINVGKALNKDIESLEVQTRTLENGTVERIYTEPNSDKVLIKTQDLGQTHREWIYGGKADLIFMEQTGDETPYIIAKKGNYTQIKGKGAENHPNFDFRSDYDNQYYYDGRVSYKDINGRQTMSIPYNETKEYQALSEDIKVLIDRNAKELPNGLMKECLHPFVDNGEIGWDADIKQVYNEANGEKIDLDDLYKPYEK